MMARPNVFRAQRLTVRLGLEFLLGRYAPSVAIDTFDQTQNGALDGASSTSGTLLKGQAVVATSLTSLNANSSTAQISHTLARLSVKRAGKRDSVDTSAVKRTLRGHQREETERFIAF